MKNVLSKGSAEAEAVILAICWLSDVCQGALFKKRWGGTVNEMLKAGIADHDAKVTSISSPPQGQNAQDAKNGFRAFGLEDMDKPGHNDFLHCSHRHEKRRRAATGARISRRR